MFDVVYREETLLNVIQSVTRNGRSIVLTAVLALILVYICSMIGYILFKDDFLIEVDDDEQMTTDLPSTQCSSDPTTACQPSPLVIDNRNPSGRERTCDTLIMCIMTTLNQGVRNGGGIGDILRTPSIKVQLFSFPPKLSFTRGSTLVYLA